MQTWEYRWWFGGGIHLLILIVPVVLVSVYQIVLICIYSIWKWYLSEDLKTQQMSPDTETHGRRTESAWPPGGGRRREPREWAQRQRGKESRRRNELPGLRGAHGGHGGRDSLLRLWAARACTWEELDFTEGALATEQSRFIVRVEDGKAAR